MFEDHILPCPTCPTVDLGISPLPFRPKQISIRIARRVAGRWRQVNSGSLRTPTLCTATTLRGESLAGLVVFLPVACGGHVQQRAASRAAVFSQIQKGKTNVMCFDQ